MEKPLNDSKVKTAQVLFAKSKLRRLRALYIRLTVCLIWSAIIIGLHYIHIENIQVDAVFSIFEMPVLWLFCIGIQFVLFYADRIPILKKWQQNLLQKIIEKERNSFESTYFNIKDNTAVDQTV